MDTIEAPKLTHSHIFDAAEMGALAHLYRGEVYRSTMWRTRLDHTTNWAVATLGIALSVTFSSREASPLPLVLVGCLVVVFLLFEARRYRYFNVWRARARWIEKNFYAPLLRGEGLQLDDGWHEVLAHDYCEPRHHISLPRAIGRRLRRTYSWIRDLGPCLFRQSRRSTRRRSRAWPNSGNAPPSDRSLARRWCWAASCSMAPGWRLRW